MSNSTKQVSKNRTEPEDDDQDVIFDSEDDGAAESAENQEKKNQSSGLRPFASNGDDDGQAAWVEEDRNGDFYISLKNGDPVFPDDRYKREFNEFAKRVKKDLERIRENQDGGGGE